MEPSFQRSDAMWSSQIGAAHRAVRSVRCWSVLLVSTVFWYTVHLVRSMVYGPGEWARALSRWSGTNVRYSGIRIDLRGLERVPADGAVFAANHASAFDICLLGATLPMPIVFVARTGVLRVPVIGSVLRRGGHIVVHRSGGCTANDEALERAVATVRNGVGVVFFPEGTRSRSDAPKRWRGGAFRVAASANVPLCPVALAGTRSIMPPGSGYIMPGRAIVEIAEPIRVTRDDALDEDFRERVRDRVDAMVRSLEAGLAAEEPA